MVVEDNISCPTTILLVLAMRAGAVNSTTIAELLKKPLHAMTRPFNVPTATTPSLPPLDTRLLIDRPAGNQQITRNVAISGLLAGITKSPVFSDFRRGSTKDLFCVGAHIKGASDYAVARHLGHRRMSHSKGVQDRYTGQIRLEVWSKQVLPPAEDDPLDSKPEQKFFKKLKGSV